MDAKKTIAAVGAVALIAAGGVVWYLNRPAPEAASIDNALEAVADGEGGSDDAATDDAASEAAEAGPLTDVTGTWSVTTEIGTFDFADATATFAGFRVDEELNTVGQTEAVGRTPAVSGDLTIDGTTLSAAVIEADFTQMVSDIPRRDSAMMRAMGVDANPTGTFTLTEPVDFGEVPEEGTSITFDAVGDLTVNGLTVPTTFAMEAQVADGNLLVVGTAPVTFADFEITAPQAGPVVSIDDNGTVEVQLWFTAA